MTLFTTPTTFETSFLLQCVFWYICNMNLLCKSCTYSQFSGIPNIHKYIYNVSKFCRFLYFKSIFIKTITSFLFGDVIHEPHSFISFKWYIIQGYCMYIQQITKYRFCVGLNLWFKPKTVERSTYINVRHI